MELGELTNKADVVLTGVVHNVSSLWSSDGKTILSMATISVDMVIEGTLSAGTVVVEYEGGEVGDIGLKVSDISYLREGDKVVLFLERVINSRDLDIEKGDMEEPAVFHIVGQDQGKYLVKDGVVRRAQTLSEDAYSSDRIPLTDLISRIKELWPEK
jgi:hypothetical protein